MDMKVSCNGYIASYMYIDFNFSHAAAVTDKFLAQLALGTNTYKELHVVMYMLPYHLL